jgi:3-deoxy-D-manno-octulosonic-acid transferase
MKRKRPNTQGSDRPLPSAEGTGFWLMIKCLLFRFLERASNTRSRLRSAPADGRTNAPPAFGPGRESIWIYVSTIGELNAIEPFLRPFIAEMAPTPVTLLTDRTIYRQSYCAKYPDAYVYEMDGTFRDVDRLIVATPPRLLLIAEIPCLLSDAPCRLPFAVVHAAKGHGAVIAIINGWTYGYAPPSRLDAIERKLFGGDYLRLIDLITVQSESVRERLIAKGANPESVHVTGNTKFDAVVRQDCSPQGKRSEAILRSIIDSERPCVVAGCVTDYAGQVMVLDAFRMVTEKIPNALLVLAPRHPENMEMITKLEALLRKRAWRHIFRRRIENISLTSDTEVLILDTIGELRDFYAASSVCYVGVNHNILEPLAFGKPVTVSPGWETTYPSYPVYELLRGMECVYEFASPEAHAESWLQLLAEHQTASSRSTAIESVLARLRGASEANSQLVRQITRTREGHR